jgi:hypothetical protein
MGISSFFARARKQLHRPVTPEAVGSSPIGPAKNSGVSHLMADPFFASAAHVCLYGDKVTSSPRTLFHGYQKKPPGREAGGFGGGAYGCYAPP